MKAAKTILLWSTDEDPQAVKITKFPLHGEENEKYHLSGLGAYTLFRDLNTDETIKAVFEEGKRVVTDYSLNPDDVHAALMGVDEYQMGLDSGFALFDTTNWAIHKKKAILVGATHETV